MLNLNLASPHSAAVKSTPSTFLWFYTGLSKALQIRPLHAAWFEWNTWSLCPQPSLDATYLSLAVPTILLSSPLHLHCSFLCLFCLPCVSHASSIVCITSCILSRGYSHSWHGLWSFMDTFHWARPVSPQLLKTIARNCFSRLSYFHFRHLMLVSPTTAAPLTSPCVDAVKRPHQRL